MKKKYILSEFLRFVAVIFFLLITHNISQAQSNSWTVPNDAVNVKNPEASDAASIKNGETLYQTYCAPCHGSKGKGDGPASASLNPKPADHTSAMVQAESDGTLYYKISEGRAHTAMPPFKAVLHPDQRWAIINYMRTLAKKSK
ncbi:MAG: cytochrome c [Ginsengibacter sp.]